MGTGQTIRCKHCGTEFMNFMGFGFIRQFLGKKESCHIETETAIRCPQCMKRLNNTEKEFNEQVIGLLLWD